MTITSSKMCPICYVRHEVVPPEGVSEDKLIDDYTVWLSTDIKIQDVMPYLNEHDREILMSGYCEEGWLKFMEEIGADID